MRHSDSPVYPRINPGFMFGGGPMLYFLYLGGLSLFLRKFDYIAYYLRRRCANQTDGDASKPLI